MLILRAPNKGIPLLVSRVVSNLLRNIQRQLPSVGDSGEINADDIFNQMDLSASSVDV